MDEEAFSPLGWWLPALLQEVGGVVTVRHLPLDDMAVLGNLFLILSRPCGRLYLLPSVMQTTESAFYHTPWTSSSQSRD